MGKTLDNNDLNQVVESGGAKREKNRKKNNGCTLGFCIRYSEDLFQRRKKPPNKKDLFGDNVFKNSSLYLAGLFKTLTPNGALASSSFSAKNYLHSSYYKNQECIFLFSSFPSPRSFFFSFHLPSLLWYWSFSGLRNLPFDAFSLKRLQISFKVGFQISLDRKNHWIRLTFTFWQKTQSV